MKKIFFALVAIFGLWSCVQEDLPPVGPTIVDSEGGYVDVTFGVSLPDMKEVTRSMTSPQITSLHLLVFNEQGMLCDKHDAVPCDENGNEITTGDMWGETSALSYFKVQLARTGMPRTIHLIANSPTAFNEYPVSSETSVITSLSVSGGQEAYWQRLEFPDGITGTPVLEDGKQVFDEEGNPRFEPSDAVLDKLTAVPMIRNYSRIEVVNASSGDTALTDVEFVLVNIPDRGSVAPYNINMGQFEAMDDSTDYDNLVIDSADHKPYTGYEPAGRQLMNNTFDGSGALVDANSSVITPTTATVGTIDDDDTISRTTDPNYLYLYERNQTLDTDNQTYVIVKGKYAGTANAQYTYYKIAIASEDENGIHSYNLLRNIQYTIVITGAVGEGFLTAAAAYGAGASNLLNYDVTTKNLTQISDGTKSLYVEYTQKVITADKAKVTLRYKYEDTSSSEDKLTTDDVTITKLPYSIGEVITGSINEGKGNTDDDGWNTLSFTAGTTPSAGSTGYSQKIKLEIEGLVREVEYILSSRYYLQLQMPDKVDSAINSSVAAKLLIQKDLPRGVFPLEFTIVAENNSLSPVNSDNTLQLSTVTNVNADGTPGGNNFGYSVTLDRLTYEAMVKDLGEDDQYVTIPLNFVTNMADAAPNGIVCSAYNEFHNLANDELYTGTLDYRLTLNPANIKVNYGEGEVLTATLRLPESIADDIWTNGEYLDFTISYSNNTLNLTGASNATIVEGKVRVTKDTYDDGIRAFALTFKTTADISATTIYADATGKTSTFKQASAQVTNNTLGALGIELNSDMSMLPGEGKTVSTTITVPKGLGDLAMTTTGNLELTITTSEAYLDLATRAATITKTDDKTFKVVIEDYNPDSEYSFDCEFITTDGNTLGTRTITVSHPYLDSASVTTSTRGYDVTWSLPAILSNNDNGTSKLAITLPDELTSDMFPIKFTITANMQYTRITFAGSTSNRIGNRDNPNSSGTYDFEVNYNQYSSSHTTEIQFAPRAGGDGNNITRSFTISLTSNSNDLEMPGGITKTYNGNSYQ